MLGRVERESPVHAALAARLGGWSATDPLDAGSWDSAPIAEEELLDLGGLTDTLATVSVMADLAAVVQIGNPAAPDQVIEDYLLRGPANLMVIAAEAVPAQWVWVGAASGVVVVDEAGLRDCREHLRNLGNPLRLVPAQASVADRMLAAGPDGSMVIERDRAPLGWAEVPLDERSVPRTAMGLPTPGEISGSPLLWYGLVDSRDHLPSFAEAAQVWLAFGPRGDYRGSLRKTLAEFSDLGLDLTHLRSQRGYAEGQAAPEAQTPSAQRGYAEGQAAPEAQTPSAQRESAGPDGLPRPHHFFSAFSCPSSDTLAQLLNQLNQHQVRHRVLAVIPGSDFQPEPIGLTPRWA